MRFNKPNQILKQKRKASHTVGQLGEINVITIRVMRQLIHAKHMYMNICILNIRGSYSLACISCLILIL